MTLVPSSPVRLPKYRRRKGRSLPVPQRSSRVYVTVEPSRVHMFRFLLEAEDNLGIMTVVDRWRAVLMVRYSPHREADLRAFLEAAAQTVPCGRPFIVPARSERGGESA